ncbi:hypothetical protein NUW58_g6334 [Xylaria curta]|uniref:Uncharacterized protein n=1 Tax=Xylaria curta TaxID=42375 RepID=A0ACC1NXC3_9PEZI|nr:hypothetical protein NUW58_g6334 [Xylaria curta]
MGDAHGDPVVSMLVRQLASLEKKYIELEAKFNALDGPKNAATTTPDKSTTDGRTIDLEPLNATGPETKPDKKEKNEATSRVKVIISKRDHDGEPIESEGELQTTKQVDDSTHAFVLKKIIFDTTSPRTNTSEINITSPELWELLKTHLRWYPYHIFSESPVTLYAPYEPIIFSWDLLRKVTSEKEGDAQARDDLSLLLDTISGGSSGDEKLDQFFKIRSNYKNQQQETIQFDDLWTIFAPGTLIYGKPFQNEGQVFVVKDNRMTWPKRNRDSGDYHPWSLVAWSYDWKDGSFGRTGFVLTFEHFDGHRPLTTLPYYPFEMHEDYESVRAKLIDRGKIFQKYCNSIDESRMFDYKGSAIPEKKGFSGMKGEETDSQNDSRSSSHIDFEFLRRLQQAQYRSTPRGAASSHVDGRVMVDYESFYQYGSTDGRNGSLSRSDSGVECGCSDCQSNLALTERYRTRFDRLPKNKEWEDEQYLMCPPREIRPRDDQDAWNSRLKLADEDTKKLLFDLVRCHVSSEAQGDDGDDDDDDRKLLAVDDIVPGKGKGLVILLYGPPGVGKTSTAETIAVAARKPLFSISVADVGTKAKHVESNLSKIFSLATHWKAILLIDEADVFLESRGRGGIVQSIDKNALVSVFLRVLEYYRGIMFLTTNQIAEFDIAIPSRIHIAIKYESLKTDQMEAIFRGFLDKLDKENLVDDYDEIMSWLKEDVYSEGLDGRQIRNTVTTALDLANADAKYNKGNNKLRKKHIKRAFNNAKNFKRDFETQMQRYKDSQNKMIK